MSNGMDGTKRSIRREMRRRRRALDPAALAAVDAAVARHFRALPERAACPIVLAYVATDGEVPTDTLVRDALADGKRVYLPRLIDGVVVFARHHAGAALRPGAYGIAEPVGEPLEVEELASAIACVPLLAWDAAGSRVGRGGGHYDRAFAGPNRPRWLVGLGYEFQQCPRIAPDGWDLRLDAVLTEHGIRRCWDGAEGTPSRKEDTQHHGLSMDCAGQHRAGRRSDVAGGLPPPPAGGGASAGNAGDDRAHALGGAHGSGGNSQRG
jgi:5-formyltetrahydrofolate cyclo-ligase